MGKAQVHDHQTEIVREGIGDEEPGTGQVLEPYLGLVCISSVHQGEAAVFHLGIDIKGCYVLPSEKLIQ
jgi:hypothetical protein